jgi:hypothetical protein
MREFRRLQFDFLVSAPKHMCFLRFLLLVALLGVPLKTIAQSEDPPANPKPKGNPVITGIKVDPKELNRAEDATVAPPNYAILSNTINGWQFVPKDLKKDYDTTLKRLESLQVEVDAGRVSAKDAMADLAELKTQLKSLRAEIEASRVHVAGARINEQIETIEFVLGDEKRLAITANHVRIVGWNEAKVKVELKKIILSVDDEPIDDQMKAVHIVHERGPAKFAGQTDAQWDASEAEFMAKQGATMTAEELASRRNLVNEIRQSYAIHRSLLGKEIDQLSVAGMDYQSNPIITTKVKSDGGEGQWGSSRQRFAELTVFVPACNSLCVRGARRGLIVEDLVAPLTIVEEDSTDSDARGQFKVTRLTGDLICRSFPLQSIEQIKGHVTVESYSEFGVEGAGTNHRDDMHEMTPARPFNVSIMDVSNGVDLKFGRVNLSLQNINGKIDVQNNFGDTYLVATGKLEETNHRIVSQSGRIDVKLSERAWDSVPVIAVTNYGGVRTNIDSGQFSDFHLSGPNEDSPVRCDWSGFRKTDEKEDRFAAIFSLLERFANVLEGKDRSNGLDLLTRSGRIVLVRQ